MVQGSSLDDARKNLRALTDARLLALQRFIAHVETEAAEFDETRRLKQDMDDLVARWTVAYHEFERLSIRRQG